MNWLGKARAREIVDRLAPGGTEAERAEVAASVIEALAAWAAGDHMITRDARLAYAVGFVVGGSQKGDGGGE